VTLSLIAATALVLAAAENRPEAMVVISKRSGLARGPALELARAFAESLKTANVPVPAPVEELSCNGKVPCLVDAARKKGFAVLVAIELGSALGDVVLHSEALSIDEDGKKIATWDEEGPQATVVSKLTGLAADFAPAIRKALGLGTPAAAVASAEPPPIPPPAPPPEPARVTGVEKTQAPPPPPGWGNSKKAGLSMIGVGAVGLITSGVLGGLTLSTVSQRDQLCPGVCTNPRAFALDASARTTQLAGIVTAIGSGLVAVAGTVLFVVHLDSRTALIPSVSEEAMMVTVRGEF
jgi:hypothetical protein